MSGQPTPAGVAALESGRRPLIAALIAFLLAGAAAVGVVWQSEQLRLHELRTHLADRAGNHADAIQRSTQHALSTTYALAALVRQGQGSIANFDAIASEMLAYYPSAASLQLAPGGIIQHVVPLADNKIVIGLNLLQDPARNKEALLARDTGKLTLGGPFELKEGGLGAVGYLPVFLDDSQGKPSFWGLTAVLIRYPQALEEARLTQLTQQGFGYELWRIHPDSGKKQSIAASSDAALIDPVTRTRTMPNGSWMLSVAPLKGWNEPLWLTLKSALGLLFSLLLGYLAKLLFESRAHERHLETLVQQRTAEISATQAKLQATFDAFPDLVWLKDAQGVYLDCNPMFERFFGTKKAAILGKTAYDLVDPELADSSREHDHQAITSNQPIVNEGWRTFAADGRRGLFEITRTPMRDGDGQLIGVLGIAHDITERKRAQDEILRFNATLLTLTKNTAIDTGARASAFQEICKATSQALDAARVSIWYYDADREVIVCEELYEQGTDTHSSGLILLQKDFPIYFAYLREKRVLAAHDAHTDATTAEFSSVYLTPLGINSMLDAPVRLEGKLWGVVCIEHVGPHRTWSTEEQTFGASMADFVAHVLSAERRAVAQTLVEQRTTALTEEITERKQAQDEILLLNANLNREMAERRSLEIELIRISEEQRRVIGCELHDGLGQHLTSLSLLCASLRQKITGLAQPEADATQRIGELIHEAIVMTRSAAHGLYPVALEHGGLTAALEQLADNASALQKIKCIFSVGPDVQVHDPLVAINLYRIAQEAITNALKYSQAGLMRINLARVDGKVRLTLSDDGIGIDPFHLELAKGLGMHSMHYRASLLGGSMEIESDAQQGTSITVTYPDDRRVSRFGEAKTVTYPDDRRVSRSGEAK